MTHKRTDRKVSQAASSGRFGALSALLSAPLESSPEAIAILTDRYLRAQSRTVGARGEAIGRIASHLVHTFGQSTAMSVASLSTFAAWSHTYRVPYQAETKAGDMLTRFRSDRIDRGLVACVRSHGSASRDPRVIACVIFDTEHKRNGVSRYFGEYRAPGSGREVRPRITSKRSGAQRQILAWLAEDAPIALHLRGDLIRHPQGKAAALADLRLVRKAGIDWARGIAAEIAPHPARLAFAHNAAANLLSLVTRCEAMIASSSDLARKASIQASNASLADLDTDDRIKRGLPAEGPMARVLRAVKRGRVQAETVALRAASVDQGSTLESRRKALNASTMRAIRAKASEPRPIVHSAEDSLRVRRIARPIDCTDTAIANALTSAQDRSASQSSLEASEASINARCASYWATVAVAV